MVGIEPGQGTVILAEAVQRAERHGRGLTEGEEEVGGQV